MCNSHMRLPTKEEQEQVKFGYKVFATDSMESKILSPFQHRIIKERSWNKTTIKYPYTEESFRTDEGFHVFLFLDNAKDYLKVLTNLYYSFTENLVIYKVKVKDIICFGQIAKGCYGSEITKADSVIQCKQIKLIEKINL